MQKEQLIQAATWINPENITLSERSQAQKSTHNDSFSMNNQILRCFLQHRRACADSLSLRHTVFADTHVGNNYFKNK